MSSAIVPTTNIPNNSSTPINLQQLHPHAARIHEFLHTFSNNITPSLAFNNSFLRFRQTRSVVLDKTILNSVPRTYQLSLAAAECNTKLHWSKVKISNKLKLFI